MNAPDVDCEQHHASLAVRDIPAAVDFYTKKLGFWLAFTWGEPPNFAGVNLGDVQMFLREGISEAVRKSPGKTPLSATLEPQAHSRLVAREGALDNPAPRSARGCGRAHESAAAARIRAGASISCRGRHPGPRRGW
jgi:catechol 2,3-dioxygenase-like lactoylglutathione lyase family enzyme